MLFISGSVAHSAFRLKKLLADLQSVNANVTEVSSQFLHIANVSNELDNTEHDVLNALLTYGEQDELSNFSPNLWSMPRFGTISPWSSKATDIVHNAGLDKVKRVERGIAFEIKATTELSQSDLQALSTVLHDRMIETIF